MYILLCEHAGLLNISSGWGAKRKGRKLRTSLYSGAYE